MIVDEGESTFCHRVSLTCGKWFDKREVLFLSTKYRDDVEQVQRMSKSGAHEIVKKPIIICDYNENMAGVDKTDQLMVYFACRRKSLKWYKRIFWRIFDHSILNAYVLFKFLINPGQKKIYSETFLNGACLYSHSTNFISMTWARLSVTCVVTLPTIMDTPTTQCKRKTEPYLTHYNITMFIVLFHPLPVCMLNHADSLHTPSLSMLRLNTCIIITSLMILRFLLKLKNLNSLL